MACMICGAECGQCGGPIENERPIRHHISGELYNLGPTSTKIRPGDKDQRVADKEGNSSRELNALYFYANRAMLITSFFVGMVSMVTNPSWPLAVVVIAVMIIVQGIVDK